MRDRPRTAGGWISSSGGTDPGARRRASRRRSVDDRPVGQGPGRAGDHALAARDARRVAHRGVEVEGDPGGEPLAHPADDLVVADLVAAPDAAVAEDAGGVVDGDDHRRVVAVPRLGPWRTARLPTPNFSAISSSSQSPYSRCLSQGEGWSAISSSVRVLTEPRTLSLGLGGHDLPPGHVGRDLAIAGRRQDPLADVHGADPADGHRVHVLAVAEDRDLDPDLLRGVVDRRARRAPRPRGRRSTP